MKMKNILMGGALVAVALGIAACGDCCKKGCEAATEAADSTAVVEDTVHSARWLDEKDMAWEPAGEGVTRQIMGYDKDLMLVKVKFETGGVGTTHTHPCAQSSCVISGKFEFVIDGEPHILGPGDGFYVPANVPHSCRNIEAGTVLDSFSPYREDFL